MKFFKKQKPSESQKFWWERYSTHDNHYIVESEPITTDYIGSETTSYTFSKYYQASINQTTLKFNRFSSVNTELNDMEIGDYFDLNDDNTIIKKVTGKEPIGVGTSSEGIALTYVNCTISEDTVKVKWATNGYVSSENESAYPVDGLQGNYWYIKVDSIPDNFIIESPEATPDFQLGEIGYYQFNIHPDKPVIIRPYVMANDITDGHTVMGLKGTGKNIIYDKLITSYGFSSSSNDPITVKYHGGQSTQIQSGKSVATAAFIGIPVLQSLKEIEISDKTYDIASMSLNESQLMLSFGKLPDGKAQEDSATIANTSFLSSSDTPCKNTIPFSMNIGTNRTPLLLISRCKSDSSNSGYIAIWSFTQNTWIQEGSYAGGRNSNAPANNPSFNNGVVSWQPSTGNSLGVSLVYY